MHLVVKVEHIGADYIFLAVCADFLDLAGVVHIKDFVAGTGLFAGDVEDGTDFGHFDAGG